LLILFENIGNSKFTILVIATRLNAHFFGSPAFAAQQCCTFLLATYRLRRRGVVGVSDNMLSADVTDCPSKDNLPSTKGFYALLENKKMHTQARPTAVSRLNRTGKIRGKIRQVPVPRKLIKD
jgi:hypothetical protein